MHPSKLLNKGMEVKNIEESATYKNLCREIEEMSAHMREASEADIPELDRRIKKASALIRKLNDEV